MNSLLRAMLPAAMLAMLVAPAVAAPAVAAPAVAAPAVAAPPADTARPAPARPDTAGIRRMRGTGAYVRLMAEADSLLKLRGGSHAEEAQLFLSWDAPYGMKRAKSVRMPACADSSLADTLYLSFYPGRSSSGFLGFSSEIYFRATGTDTLGPWWHMEGKGGENGGNMVVEFGPSENMPGRQPWTAYGQGFGLLDRTPTALRLRALFAVSLDAAIPLPADSVYTLCRVILRHRPERRLAGCGQPVCVEWKSAKFGFALKDEPEVRRGERWVSYGGGAAVCDVSRGPAVRAWKPNVPAGSK